MLRISCPQCKRSLAVAEANAGKKLRCPGCATVFTAAPAAPPALAPQAVRPAAPNELRPPVPGHQPPVGEAVATRPAPPPPRLERSAPDADDLDFRRGGRPPSRPVRPLRFALRVKADPDRKLRGAFAAEATPEGCRLRQGKKHDLFLPTGTFAEYREGNRVAVEIDGRVVEFQVVKPGAYNKRLARDFAAFLSGQGGALHAKGYTLEWYLLVPVVLPLAIPILTLGGAVPAVIGVGGAAIGYMIAQVEKWPAAIRALCCWGVAGGAYLALLSFLVVVAVVQMARQAPPTPNAGPGAPPVQEDGEKPLTTLKASSVVCGVAFSRDGNTLATGDGYFGPGGVRLWDLANGKPPVDLPGYTDQVFAVAFSPDGRTLATGSGDAVVRLWDARTNQLRAALPRQPSYVRGVAFSSDGRTLASVCDGALTLWDVNAAQEKRTCQGHEGIPAWRVPVSISFSPDGKLLAAGGGQAGVKLWDAEKGVIRTRLPGGDIVLCTAFSPDGKLLAAGGFDKTAHVWNADTLKETAVARGHDDWVYALAFSPDSKWLATASRDGTARLWDAASGKQVAILKCPGEVLCVAFSPDGRKLATGGKDNTVEIWDAARILGNARP